MPSQIKGEKLTTKIDEIEAQGFTFSQINEVSENEVVIEFFTKSGSQMCNRFRYDDRKQCWFNIGDSYD